MNQQVSNFDEKLFLSLNGFGHSSFLDALMLLASNLALCIPILILVAIVVTLYNKKQGYHPVINSVVLISVLLFVFLFCLEFLPKVFSLFANRERPCLNPNISVWVRLLGEECDPGNNFFAVRPCIMFCITSFLLFTIRNDFTLFKIILVLWSILVSYSRIYLGAHYPSNVLIADLTGILFGFLGSRFYFYLKYQVLVI